MSGLFGGGVGARDLAALRRLDAPDPPKLAIGSKRRAARFWTPDEDDVLRRAYQRGGGGTLEAAALTGRSPAGCWLRATRHLGAKNPNRHLVSIPACARQAGVSRSRAWHATRALGLPVVSRSGASSPPKRPASSITGWLDPVAAAALVRALATAPPRIRSTRPGSMRSDRGRWGVGCKPRACLFCGSSKAPHYACGLCARDYLRMARAGVGLAPIAPGRAHAFVAPSVPRVHLCAVYDALSRARVGLTPIAAAERAGIARPEAHAVLEALLDVGLVARARDRGGKRRAYALVTGRARCARLGVGPWRAA